MKWERERVEKLKGLCFEEKSNKDIAEELGVSIKDVYAKRSQLGLTINKIKAEKKKDREPIKKDKEPKVSALTKAFNNLENELLLKAVSDWNTEKTQAVYVAYAVLVGNLQQSMHDTIKILNNKTEEF